MVYFQLPKPEKSSFCVQTPVSPTLVNSLLKIMAEMVEYKAEIRKSMIMKKKF